MIVVSVRSVYDRSVLKQKILRRLTMKCYASMAEDIIHVVLEKMKRKVTKSNCNCDYFCEHFESVELCKECLQNTKLHRDPVDFMDNIGMFKQ